MYAVIFFLINHMLKLNHLYTNFYNKYVVNTKSHVVFGNYPGDFAVLVRSGLTLKKAVYFNLVSSIPCFIGCIIGLSVGNLSSTSSWIFAGVGGMFLYVTLVDLVGFILYWCLHHYYTLALTDLWLCQEGIFWWYFCDIDMLTLGLKLLSTL